MENQISVEPASSSAPAQSAEWSGILKAGVQAQRLVKGEQ